MTSCIVKEMSRREAWQHRTESKTHHKDSQLIRLVQVTPGLG